MELQTAQELYDQSLCIFPDCNAFLAMIPVKNRHNLNQHIRTFKDHNTPEANAYKQRLIGKLTVKWYKTTKLVSDSPLL